MSYSDEMIAELHETAEWDFAKATAYGKKHMVKPRSVVAKVLALGLPYKKASDDKPTKGPSKVSKATLVAEVQVLLGVSAPSLDKVNMADLTLILESLRAN